MSILITPEQTLRLGLIVSPILYALAVLYTRARAVRVLGSLAGGLAYAAVSFVWDRIAADAGWWSTRGLPGGVPPLVFYLPVALAYGGVGALLGWRIVRRWGRTGLAAFLAGWTVFGLVHDFTGTVLDVESRLLEFGPGPVPVLADALLWASAAAIGQAVMWLVAGAPETDALAGQPTAA